MKNCNAPENRTTRRILLIASAIVLALAFTVSLSQPARADNVIPPPMPDNLKVDPANKAFLVGHAVGTQNYICLPSGAGFAFTLFTPQATLFTDADRQIITHFFSPNLNPIPPEVEGTIRATWQHSRDTSTVWASATATATHATDPTFVAQGAIAWVLLTVVGALDGTDSDTLTDTTFIQRLNTAGGVAPSTGCASLADVGREEFVPYTADYFFYKKFPPSRH